MYVCLGGQGVIFIFPQLEIMPLIMCSLNVYAKTLFLKHCVYFQIDHGKNKENMTTHTHTHRVRHAHTHACTNKGKNREGTQKFTFKINDSTPPTLRQSLSEGDEHSYNAHKKVTKNHRELLK